MDIESKELDKSEMLELCEIENMDDYRYYKIIPSFSVRNVKKMISYFILRREINEMSKIPLIVLSGFSRTEFCENVKLLNNRLEKLEEYREIIIINLERLKNVFFEYNQLDLEDRETASEEFKKIIATHIDKILRIILFDNGYNEFDLMGFNDGGGLSILLSAYPDIPINKLYLSNPLLKSGFYFLKESKNYYMIEIIISGIMGEELYDHPNRYVVDEVI